MTPTVIFGQVVAETKLYLLYSGELDTGRYDAPLAVKKRERNSFSNKICF
jgi:hypothetical protein